MVCLILLGTSPANGAPTDCHLGKDFDAFLNKLESLNFNIGDEIVIHRGNKKYEGKFLSTSSDGNSNFRVEFAMGGNRFDWSFDDFDAIFKIKRSSGSTSRAPAFAATEVKFASDGQLIVKLNDGATLTTHDKFISITDANGKALEANYRFTFATFKDNGKIVYRVHLENGLPTKIENVRTGKIIDVSGDIRAAAKRAPKPPKNIVHSEVVINGERVKAGYFAVVNIKGNTHRVRVVKVYRKRGKEFLDVEYWVNGKAHKRPFKIERSAFVGPAIHDVSTGVPVRGGFVSSSGVERYVKIMKVPENHKLGDAFISSLVDYQITRIWVDENGTHHIMGRRIRRNSVTGKASLDSKVEELTHAVKVKNSQIYNDAFTKGTPLPGEIQEGTIGGVSLSKSGDRKYVAVNNKAGFVEEVFIDDSGRLSARIRFIGKNSDGSVAYYDEVIINEANPKGVRFGKTAKRVFDDAAKRRNNNAGSRWGRGGGAGRGSPPPRGGSSKMTRSEARDILGIGINVTEKEAKPFYRKLARKYHPDFHPKASKAEKKALEEKLKKINNAWDTLFPKAEQNRR